MSQSLILTLLLNEVDQAFYEKLRIQYFPPERNLVPAHLSLFHQLPDDEPTHQTLHNVACGFSAFQLTNPKAKSIGRGAAVFFESHTLAALHANLSTAFEPHLIPQDRQPLRPHIVVQNKVDSETARQALQQLQSAILVEPHAVGVTVWRYLDGPWEHLYNIKFGSLPQRGPFAESKP